MADARGLRLKSERTVLPTEITREKPIARVLVDTPAAHLEDVYDYSVPANLSDLAVPGSIVQVEFNRTLTSGLVLARANEPETKAGLKTIQKSLSPGEVLTSEIRDLILEVAHQYAGTRWDVIRSALPSRVQVVERQSFEEGQSHQRQGLLKGTGFLSRWLNQVELKKLQSTRIQYAISLPPSAPPLTILSELIALRAVSGQVLIVVPDEKTIELLQRTMGAEAQSILWLGSHLTKQERYRAHLHAIKENYRIIVGTRSAIFTHLMPRSTLIIYNEADESHYERRAPGWNTREVALIRSQQHSMIFLHQLPSLELFKRIEDGKIEQMPMHPTSTPQYFGEWSREPAQELLAKGLKKGSVLVSVARTGYTNGFCCQKCEVRASCSHCHGYLEIEKPGSAPSCLLCGERDLDWRCHECGNRQMRIFRRGVQRYAQEYGRIFPGFSIIVSSEKNQVRILPPGKHLVIATPGSEPYGEYQTIVANDGLLRISYPSIRSEEELVRHWFSLGNYIAPGGSIFLTLPNHHPVIQGLLRWNYGNRMRAELLERDSAHLPPMWRSLVVFSSHDELLQIKQGLTDQGEFSIFGPLVISTEMSRMVICAPTHLRERIRELAKSLQRIKSIKGKTPLRVRIDPYSLIDVE